MSAGSVRPRAPIGDVTGCPPDLAAVLAQSEIDAELVRGFQDAQRQAGLILGERPLCSVLSPLVVSRRFYRRVETAATLVGAAMERLVERALVDEGLRTTIGVDGRERDLYMAADVQPVQPAVVVGRLDMMVTCGASDGRDSFAFIELNAESPAGITDQLGIEETLYQLPPLRRWLADRRPQRSDAPRALLEALRETHHHWGGDGDPSIAIVDWRAGDTSPEQERLCRYFSAAGSPAVCADPDELRYEGARLRVGDRAIDLVYRRFTTRELLDRTDAAHPLRRALRDRAVCIANPLHSTIANRKGALAVLSDPVWDHLFSAEQIQALRRHVPWSRVLDRRACDRDELAELVVERQRDLVIKPNDAYGGQGVVPGWTVDEPSWRAALQRGFAERGVVQQRVLSRRLWFPTFGDAGAIGLARQELAFDCDPFLFRGRVAGAMVRVSAAALCNVSAGGGVTGLFVRDDDGRDDTVGGASV